MFECRKGIWVKKAFQPDGIMRQGAFEDMKNVDDGNEKSLGLSEPGGKSGLFPERDAVHDGRQKPQGKIGAGREHKNKQGGIMGTENGGSENHSPPDQFAHRPEDCEGKGKTDPHPKPVGDGREEGIFGSKGLGAPQDDAVDRDQGDIKAKGLVQGKEVSRHDKIHNGHEGGDDDDKGGNANL